jgi:acyl-CoA oxidase
VIAPLDPAPLRRILDGDYAETRNRIRAELEKPELVIADPEISREEYRERVLTVAKGLAERGETGLAYPPEYGGDNAVGASIAAFETMAFGDLSLVVKFGVQFGLWGGAVLHLGTKKHHDRYLKDTSTLDLPGCFAMSESFHGSNVQHVQTTATYEDGGFTIHTPDEHARKDWIGNAAKHGRMAAVFCQLEVGGEERGVHCLLVPIRDEQGRVCEGVTIEDCGHKLGLNGVDNGRLSFDHVRVERDALLDRYATVSEDGVYESPIENPNKRFFTMLGTLIQGRVSVGGAGISVAKVASTIAVRHALKRRQFGAPGSEDETLLLDYRTHQRRLLPDLATTYALHFAQAESVATTHRVFTEDDFPDDDRRMLETRAAAIKAMATWHATHTVQECREACGGLGYLTVNRFAALKADSDVFTTFEGDNLVLRQLVAKNLLTDFGDELGELDPLGTVAFFAGQIFEQIAERTAVRELVGRVADDLLPFRGDEPDLLDRDHQLHLFSWREEHMRGGAARRLKGGIDAGGDPFRVLIEVQDHVVDVARVHTEKIVLESFARAVDACEDAVTKEVLDQLCSLYALWHVERDRGWFQEHGKLSSTASKAVLKAVNSLCEELRPQAAALVDAFGIPDRQLPLPANAQVALAQ